MNFYALYVSKKNSAPISIHALRTFMSYMVQKKNSAPINPHFKNLYQIHLLYDPIMVVMLNLIQHLRDPESSSGLLTAWTIYYL